jgi:hypothetical protein
MLAIGTDAEVPSESTLPPGLTRTSQRGGRLPIIPYCRHQSCV